MAEDFIKKARNFAVHNGSLTDAVDLMNQLHLEQLPELSAHDSSTWLGVIDRKKIMKAARKCILEKAA